MTEIRSTPLTPTEGSVDADVHDSFAAFYEAEVRAVIGLAYVLSGSRTGADDLAQDAFVAAFRQWDRLRGYERPGAWVRHVLVNRAISTARRRAAEAKALLRLGGQRVVVPDLSADTEDLWAAVRRLPRRQAQVIALYYWDGFGVSEIAGILELSDASVKTHLQRARGALSVVVADPTTTETTRNDPERPEELT